MSATVQLNVFSGRPNPTWLLNDEQARELLDRVHQVETKTPLKAAGSVGGLGYRGFTVTSDAKSTIGETRLAVHAGVVDTGRTDLSLFDESREIESWLLETATVQFDKGVREHVTSMLAVPAQEALRDLTDRLIVLPPPSKCTPKAADAPAYNPGLWNIPTVQPYNNCYNYANDQRTNTFAQPGRAHGKMYTKLTCASVQPAAQADGLVPTASFSTKLAAGKGWYVALVIWPNTDYHWYRQDANGCWSHKPGGTAARNVDNGGHTITDPKTANRGPYTTFCSYMITNRHVVIK